MSWTPPDAEEQEAGLLPWKGQQLQSPNTGTEQQAHVFQKFGHFAAKLWFGIKGYTWNDINRLKEAGVRQVEAKAAKDFAEADERIANAAKAHAEAEKAQAEAQAIHSKIETDRMEAQVRALERLQAVISNINQKGGQVAFDSEELKRIVLLIGERFPKDRELNEAKAELESRGKKSPKT